MTTTTHEATIDLTCSSHGCLTKLVITGVKVTIDENLWVTTSITATCPDCEVSGTYERQGYAD